MGIDDFNDDSLKDVGSDNNESDVDDDNVNEDIDLHSLEVTEELEGSLSIRSDEHINDELDLESLEHTVHKDDVSGGRKTRKSKLKEKTSLTERYKAKNDSRHGSVLMLKEKTAVALKKRKKRRKTSTEEESFDFQPDKDEERTKSTEETSSIFSTETKASTFEFTRERTGTIVDEEDETFLATSALEARLAVRAGTLKRKVFNLSGDAVVLGRSIDADITVPDPRASRRHAKVKYLSGNYIIEDMNSSNGVKVNGRKIKKQVLQSQDKISIGNTVLEFMLVDSEKFADPDDRSIEIDFDPDPATVMGTELAGSRPAMKSLTSSIQSAETEVAEDDGPPVTGLEVASPSLRGTGTLDGALKTGVDGVTDLKSNVMADLSDRPVKMTKLLKPFFLSIILIVLLAMLSVLMVYESTENSKSSLEENQKAIVPDEPSTGLTVEEETLAIQYYNSAKEYYENEEFENAIMDARKALEIFPGFSQARDIISYSKAALKEIRKRKQSEKERLAEEKKFKRMEDILNRADALLIKKKYSKALVPINKALSLDRGNEEAMAMLKEAKEGIRDQKRAARARIDRRKTMLMYLARGESFLKTGNYVAALRAYNRVLVMGRRTSPTTYDRASKMHGVTRRKILEKYAPQIEEAKSRMSTLNYSEAFKILNKVVQSYPAHTEAMSLRKRALEELTLQVKKIYQNALVLESVNDLEEANMLHQKILKMAPQWHVYYKKSLEKLKKYN